MRLITYILWYFTPGYWLHEGGRRQAFARRVYNRHYGYLGRVLRAEKGDLVV